MPANKKKSPSSLSPKGDLGARRNNAAPNSFKNQGGILSGTELGSNIGEIGSIGSKDPAIGTTAGPLGHRETYQRTGRFPGVSK